MGLLASSPTTIRDCFQERARTGVSPTSARLEQVRFYGQALAFLGTLDPHEFLALGGDFNTTLEDRDRSGVETFQAAVGVLREIMDHHSLVDVWRDHHPDDDVTFTYVRVGSVVPLPVGLHLYLVFPSGTQAHPPRGFPIRPRYRRTRWSHGL
ncbi:unnamed protein product [Lepidochelys kempii]